MKSKSFQYLSHLHDILNKIQDTEWKTIDSCSKKIAEAIADKHALFAYGASHAGILSQELFYRAGGLATFNPILPSDVMLNTRPVTLTTSMERLDGYASIILKHTPIKAGDILILHSVSGRNKAIIEMALEAKKLGIITIGVTNLTYSKQLTSRHESGKMLYEVCDYVLDNCGDFEDASTHIDGLDQKVAPTSTIAGCTIVNMMLIRTVEYLLEMGIEPPIFRSANADGGDEFNDRIFEEYKDAIHYM